MAGGGFTLLADSFCARPMRCMQPLASAPRLSAAALPSPRCCLRWAFRLRARPPAPHATPMPRCLCTTRGVIVKSSPPVEALGVLPPLHRPRPPSAALVLRALHVPAGIQFIGTRGCAAASSPASQSQAAARAYQCRTSPILSWLSVTPTPMTVTMTAARAGHTDVDPPSCRSPPSVPPPGDVVNIVSKTMTRRTPGP
jgi:hypothetical protein